MTSQVDYGDWPDNQGGEADPCIHVLVLLVELSPSRSQVRVEQ